MGSELVAVSFNAEDAAILGNYGVNKVLNIEFGGNFDAKIYASGIQEAAKAASAKVVVVEVQVPIADFLPIISCWFGSRLCD